MEKEIQQLVEMGATVAQARAALNKYKDVMQAAERIFDGSFDHVLDDDGDEDFADYDSDVDLTAIDACAGIFFSKDRREEVIEVEEEPEVAFVPEMNEKVALMTQGQWMKGCPEGGEQSFLFSLYRELSEGECRCPHGCGGSVSRKKRDFFSIFAEFHTYVKYLRQIVPHTCAICRKQFCLACGESFDLSKQEGCADEDAVLFHCSNLQGVVLGVGLTMLEKMYVEQTQDGPGDQGQKGRSGKRRKTETLSVPVQHVLDDDDEDDDEDGYYPPVKQSKKAKGGVGYAGDVREDTSGQVEAQAVQRAKDEKLAELLSRIRIFLPSLHRPGGARTSDYLVHPTALAHLRRRFNFVSSQLLRNDSLADMSDRSVLYIELFEWLETISCHEALASMMAMPIMVVASVKSDVTRKSPLAGNTKVRERAIVYEGSSGPRELLEAIAIQAQAAVKGLEGPKQVETTTEMTEEEKRRTTNDEKGKSRDTGRTLTEENKKMLDFCQRILGTTQAIDRSLHETKGDAFVNRLHASLPKIPAGPQHDAPQVHAGDTEESAIKAYVEWANRVRFEYCDLEIERTEPVETIDDQTPHYKFYFNNDARMLVNTDIPKRSLAIAKELAVLTTNLPVAWNSSIFLRVDETRVDIIKVLITGPEGTPYYNGCYLFDVFLGANYNQSPPNVKYMTTNGGKYRFNPNLYADGKVCLSLLGTWAGPGWIAGKSTLLQVLISIQSMILCEEPYLNEPGWAGSAGTPQSRAYSANVRRMVVRTAMLGNLKNPPEPFEDVIRTHYRLKARSIMKQLDEWLAIDDGKPITDGGYGGHKASAGGSSSGFQADVQELKGLLTKLQLEDGAGVSS
ncbi:hypothetical protein POSPLADRAFT_1067248 [Postia placenta MAD-698-R-SB12]|uniref:UBC core domain-containing protein n=1 Tax=Postia placenta MAD-698-R-SB12 TaxID=670580 RepID=A0A1X6MTJ1_9APHY|nr:hypothetical protein POSPLADRAFT_1067248 [Postia placenta MAD-698-R-SB12]OSX59536.1 hypothetical protein POSPLADRAFT_1067248 [Postia placenta MAD-698-R-SB12]